MRTASDAAPKEGAERASQVRRIFSEIAPRYDLLNHVLSLNVDRAWRSAAIARLGWERAPEGTYLDACAGTFDLSLALAARKGFRGRVVASDFAQPMLNSIGVSIAAVVLSMIINSMIAFVLAWIEFPGRRVLFLAILATLMIALSLIHI